MRFLFNLSLCGVFLLTQTYSRSAFSKSSQIPLGYQAAVAAEILNHSKDLKTLLELIRPLMTKDESAGLFNYVLEKKIDLNLKLATAKPMQNNIILSSGEEFKILDGGRVSYNGKQFSKTQPYDLLIRDIEKRLGPQQSMLDLLIPQAHAWTQLIIAGVVLLVLIVAGRSAFRSTGLLNGEMKLALGNLRITKCTLGDVPQENAITFSVGDDQPEAIITAAQAGNEPPGLFAALFKSCMQRAPLIANQIGVIIKDNVSKDPTGAAKALVNSVNQPVSH